MLISVGPKYQSII